MERVQELLEWTGNLLPDVLQDRVPSGPRRRELLGALWEHCYEKISGEPERYAAADPGRFRGELTRLVDEALAKLTEPGPEPRSRSGAIGVFMDAQLRDVSAPPEEPSEAGAELPLIAEALKEAERQRDGTLLRNLRWMEERDRGTSYSAIAADASTKEATVRTGVRRARQEVRRIAYERKRAASAPHRGTCPGALRPARDAWEAGETAEASRHLEGARETHGDAPYFLYLEALVADDSGDREVAIELLCRVLVADDDGLLRAKVLNTLGCIADDRGDLDAAGALWNRALRLEPSYAPALLNGIKNACDRRDALALHVALDELGQLLSRGTLSEQDRSYLVRRLDEHPDLGWARRFDAWRRGPTRWIARLGGEATREQTRGRARMALGSGALLFVALILWSPAHGAASAPPDRNAAPALRLVGSGDKGTRHPEPPSPWISNAAMARGTRC